MWAHLPISWTLSKPVTFWVMNFFFFVNFCQVTDRQTRQTDWKKVMHISQPWISTGGLKNVENNFGMDLKSMKWVSSSQADPLMLVNLPNHALKCHFLLYPTTTKHFCTKYSDTWDTGIKPVYRWHFRHFISRDWCESTQMFQKGIPA